MILISLYSLVRLSYFEEYFDSSHVFRSDLWGRGGGRYRGDGSFDLAPTSKLVDPHDRDYEVEPIKGRRHNGETSYYLIKAD